MKAIASLLSLVLLPVALLAADDPKEIPLWPKGAPGSEGKTEPEVVKTSAGGDRSVWSIHNPNITPYLPAKEKATGVAVLVCPGGGHRNLAIEHEGYNVAKWFQERGIAAFVLKYRLARETNSTYTIIDHAFADHTRALRLIRSRAAEWNIDPAKVGTLGFSAGGELSVLAAMRFDDGKPDATDLIERQGSKPAFHALIYPGNSKSIAPLKDSPPVFIVCGFGDRQDIAEGMADVYLRYKKAGVPAELHIYSNAGHGFGLRASNKSSAGRWADRFTDWLTDRGMLPKP